jgi:hypothetical protein
LVDEVDAFRYALRSAEVNAIARAKRGGCSGGVGDRGDGELAQDDGAVGEVPSDLDHDSAHEPPRRYPTGRRGPSDEDRVGWRATRRQRHVRLEQYPRRAAYVALTERDTSDAVASADVVGADRLVTPDGERELMGAYRLEFGTPRAEHGFGRGRGRARGVLRMT